MAPSSRTAIPIQELNSGISGDPDRVDQDYLAGIRVRLRDVDEANDSLNVTQDDGEVSEQEEQESAQQNNHQEDAQEQLRNDEAAAENESDTEFNFNEAETDSDSDDNQSTQDAQRSVQTGATAGSDTGDASSKNKVF